MPVCYIVIRYDGKSYNVTYQKATQWQEDIEEHLLPWWAILIIVLASAAVLLVLAVMVLITVFKW